MAMMPESRIGGGSRSVLGAELYVHPAELADVHLPAAPSRFSVIRPTLLLPGNLRVSVASDMPYDVASKWWDSLTVAGSVASQWYATQHHGWPGGPGREA
ncbi:energy transducer TonB [Frankia sp. AiPs1]|uniref:energy transducer TonB n=1 Tax=Frankia sp. AiPs1 TaxID=573493 RepID=UPI002044513F|nr:energy transducer TonB [Frankia sp. AiPs1]MCM3924212.1 energy transducer TonB [Frankia sp. AiPs1]